MNGAGRNIAAVTGAIGLGFSGHGEREFAGEDDVGGFVGVSVVGIVPLWWVLPNVGVGEAFVAEFSG